MWDGKWSLGFIVFFNGMYECGKVDVVISYECDVVWVIFLFEVGMYLFGRYCFYWIDCFENGFV